MYKFVDQPVEYLTTGSQFILWAMRGWVASASQHRCPTVTLAPAFHRVALREILDDFHELMMQFHHERCRCGAFNRLHASRITETEAVMLALWSDTVAGRYERIHAVLTLMVPKSLVVDMQYHMDRIAKQMTAVDMAPAGLRVSNDAASNDPPLV